MADFDGVNDALPVATAHETTFTFDGNTVPSTTFNMDSLSGTVLTQDSSNFNTLKIDGFSEDVAISIIKSIMKEGTKEQQEEVSKRLLEIFNE